MIYHQISSFIIFVICDEFVLFVLIHWSHIIVDEVFHDVLISLYLMVKKALSYNLILPSVGGRMGSLQYHFSRAILKE